MTTAAEYAEKIAALFRKAEGTDNEHERETFTNKALNLMAKWGVDDAMLEAANAKVTGDPTKMEKDTIELRGVYKVAWMQLAAHLRAGLGTVQVVRSGDSTLFVVGARSDLQRFRMLFESLMAQGEASMKEWWKPYAGTHTAADGKAHRRQFLFSFAATVGARLKAEQQAATAETTGADLVLLDRGKQAQLAVRDLIGATTAGRRPTYRGGGTHAAAAGRAAGERARLTAAAAAIG